MRILLLHNHYQSASPSGEDIAFENERQLLQSAGHEVITYSRHNDSIGDSFAARTNATLSLFWSQRAYRDIAQLIAQHRPDIAHFHNTFPLISSSGYRACQNNGVPVVQTLHNYRLICPGALLLRNGKPCEDCIEGSLLNAVRHACYRNSHTATALVAGMVAANRSRGMYATAVNRYICLTEFARDRFARGGLPRARLAVRANALMNPPAIGAGQGRYALFVGRLGQEKGVATLLRAWQGISQLPLRVVGEGPLGEVLRQQAAASNAPVTFLGFRHRPEVFELMRNATMLIIPSECYEGFPVTAMEGMASGTPMIVSAIGALDEILDAPSQCLKFPPGDAEALRTSVMALNNQPQLQQQMRKTNREVFESRYAPEQALQSLLDIYRAVLSERHTTALSRSTQIISVNKSAF